MTQNANGIVLVAGVLTITNLETYGRNGAANTGAVVYAIKRLMYRIVFDNAVHTAKHIFVPTQVVKDEVTQVYSGTTKKVSVTYEGIDTNLTKQSKKTFLTQNKIKEPFFLYVGNAYPHKNLSTLIESLIQVNTERKVTLVIVTPKNIFAKRLQKTIELLDAKQFVTVLTNVSDQSLSQLYSAAHAFVFPSLSEGFGLPGLESMAIGTPVLASDIAVFHEVYGSAAEYFDPNSVHSLSSALNKSLLAAPSVREKRKELGLKQATKYSWNLMVKTLNVTYNAFK
jgi:glycosyltransferase involved in cell wall biosynthesis